MAIKSRPNCPSKAVKNEVKKPLFHATLGARKLHDSRVNPSMKWHVSTIVSTSLPTSAPQNNASIIEATPLCPPVCPPPSIGKNGIIYKGGTEQHIPETLDFIGEKPFSMVGPRGFEPLTFCTPSKRATRLRYGPKTADSIPQYPGAVKGADSLFPHHPHARQGHAAQALPLNSHFYIVPGLGDAGDRIFGTL